MRNDCSEKINQPIGFMDSGLGGLSVLREAIKIMPYEDFIYYGDSANAPYGVKETELIRKLTFDVVDKLMNCGIKGLAVACNTATGAAVKQLRIKYPRPSYSWNRACNQTCRCKQPGWKSACYGNSNDY